MATTNPYERMTNEEIDAQVETLKKMGFTPTQKQIGLVREGKRAFYSPEQLQGLQGGAKTAPVEETGASSVAEGLVPPRQFDSPYVKESELGAGGVRRGLTVQQVPEDVELNRLRVEEKYAKLDQERRGELNRRLEESTAKGLKENEEFEKAKVKDQQTRDLQEIEAKLKEFQSPTGYNMPGTEKEAVSGTGIYKTPEGGYSNRGVTGITRALTSGQKAEVANLEDRRRELEALQGGKAYTPRAKAELGPTDKLQKAMLETQIKNIDSQITKAKSGELDTSSMEDELTEMGVPPSKALGKVDSNSTVYPTAVMGLYVQMKTAQRNAMFHQYDVVYGAGGGEDITGLTGALTAKTVAAPAAGGQGTPAPAKPTVETPPISVGQNIGGKIVEKVAREKGTGRWAAIFPDGTTAYADAIQAAQGVEQEGVVGGLTRANPKPTTAPTKGSIISALFPQDVSRSPAQQRELEAIQKRAQSRLPQGGEINPAALKKWVDDRVSAFGKSRAIADLQIEIRKARTDGQEDKVSELQKRLNELTGTK